jgi:diguanylate cyclase (GGDEF)-like protein
MISRRWLGGSRRQMSYALKANPSAPTRRGKKRGTCAFSHADPIERGPQPNERLNSERRSADKDRRAPESRDRGLRITSFKFKLVVLFVILSLLPLAAAFIGFSSAARQTATRVVDAELEAGMRAAIAAYEERLAQAAARARAVAGDEDVQRALAARDRGALTRLLRETPNVRIEAAGLAVGLRREASAERRVAVVTSADAPPIGTVVAAVPLDSALVGLLKRRSGLEQDDRLVLAVGDRVVAGIGFGALLSPAAGAPRELELAGRRYRALAASSPGDSEAVRLTALTPVAAIEDTHGYDAWRLAFTLAGALALVALAAYLLGRSIVRTLGRVGQAADDMAQGRLGRRVPVRGGDELANLGRSFNQMARQLELRLEQVEAERRRLREATHRFADALAATHDTSQLLRSITETVVEATNATGGSLVDPSGSTIAAAGQPGEGRVLSLPVTSQAVDYGELILSGAELSIQDVETASLLLGQGLVALENARLHRVVQRQALVDGLTGVSNRRHADELLAAELTRSRRLSSEFAIVLADLDNFKDVNDRLGHPAGDLVLREFGEVLRESLREIDVSARWGGEEFALILPGADAVGAAEVAERVRASLEERTIVTPEGDPICVTASFGVASFPHVADSEDGLVAAADEALYAAKRAGKNRVVTAAVRLPTL